MCMDFFHDILFYFSKLINKVINGDITHKNVYFLPLLFWGCNIVYLTKSYFDQSVKNDKNGNFESMYHIKFYRNKISKSSVDNIFL